MKLKRGIMWTVLMAIGLLIALSAVGAFYGAEKAKLLFNSAPLAVYWYVLAVLLLAGLVEFGHLLRKPGLLMMHAGCLFILAGGMWGSEAGHRLTNRLFGKNKIPHGYMVIYEGQLQNTILSKTLEELGRLPFSIKLNDFRIDYYEPDQELVPQLYIDTPDGRHFELAAAVGNETTFDQLKLRVVRTFTNFKIRINNGEKIVTDEKDAGENPAVEVHIQTPDGNSYTRYVFERSEEHAHTHDGLQLSYITARGQQLIRDYFSDVVVIEDEKEIVHKTIEVNDPLHYRGYHFYQYSYDPKEGKYTTLSVTSDSGLYAVYTGYWLLCLGMVWQFWFRHITEYVKNILKMRHKSHGD